MAQTVSNAILRGMLQAVKRTSGRDYPRLLEQAGMTRYLTTLPPANDNPACSAEEYSRLPAVVYGMLGEGLTRLFLRNAGANLATRAVAHPGIKALAAGLEYLPPVEQLHRFV